MISVLILSVLLVSAEEQDAKAKEQKIRNAVKIFFAIEIVSWGVVKLWGQLK
jgi:hypothetical protein